MVLAIHRGNNIITVPKINTNKQESNDSQRLTKQNDAPNIDQMGSGWPDPNL